MKTKINILVFTALFILPAFNINAQDSLSALKINDKSFSIGDTVMDKSESFQENDFNSPSYDYNLYLNSKKIIKCDPIKLIDDSLLISEPAGPNKLYVGDIRKVVKINQNMGLMGIVTGGVLGGLVGFAISSSTAQSQGFGFKGVPYVAAALGFVIGGTIGGIIASALSKDDIYSLDKMDKEKKISQLRKIINEK
jgi:hypothetical protein